MRRRVRSRLRSDAYRGRVGMPGRLAVGRNGRRAFRAVGLCRVCDQRRDPVSSLLSSSMPDRARVHAANFSGRSQCGGSARARLARRFEVNRWMAGLEGEPLKRGGWLLLLPKSDPRFAGELRQVLIDSAFAALDGTLKRSVRRSRHAETWLERLRGGRGPIVYIKVIDAA